MKHSWICIIALGLASCGAKKSEAKTEHVSGPPASGPGPASTVPPNGQRPDAGQPPKATKPSLTRSVEYYDGPTKRKLWLSEELVAEFDPSDAGRDAVLRGDPSAKEVEQPQKSVRLWRVHAVTGTDKFARAASSETVRFSPVLHDGPAPGLPMRAMPGGIVVTFPKDWDRTRIDGWLGARELKVEGDVAPEANMALVSAPPGLDSVRIANELHETGELVDAVPNFWQQATTR